MITIDQLLESVDLDFEPRWVTKDMDGWIRFFPDAPIKFDNKWIRKKDGIVRCMHPIKLAEFDGKDWTECIYEVPRKTDEYEQNLEKLRPADSDLVYRVHLPRKTTGKIEKIDIETVDNAGGLLLVCAAKINETIDAVNELKGAKNENKM